MTKGFTLVAAVCFGAVLGACVRDVVSVARAQPEAMGGARYQYKVVGPSMSIGGMQEDLDSMSAQGWRFVAAIGTAPVFERAR